MGRRTELRRYVDVTNEGNELRDVTIRANFYGPVFTEAMSLRGDTVAFTGYIEQGEIDVGATTGVFVDAYGADDGFTGSATDPRQLRLNGVDYRA